MAPKSDRKYAEVFDALEKVGQFTQDKRQTILNTALSAPTAGLPINQIKGAIGNTIDGIKSAGKFANNNPQIQGVLDNEYLNLASGLNPVTGAAFAFGNLSKLAGSLNPNNSKTKSRPKASGTKIKIGDKYYDTGFHSKEISELRKQNPGGGNAAQSVGTGLSTGLNTGTGSRDYLTERGKLTKDSTAEDIKKVEDIGMTAWAKANPGLASKVKPGQSGYELIKNMSGQGTDAYDANETFKPSDIPEADRQNPVEQAKARGITNLQDAQSFKNTAMDALLTASQDPNVTPIVEGITIPTTTNYAGAFNQADMPDLQSMMTMGEELGSLGIQGPKFAQSQKFKDLFMNTMLGK